MKKLIATTCVVAWSFCVTFGYLALTALRDDSPQTTIEMVLAMAGLALGMTTWVSLSRDDARRGADGLPHPRPSLGPALSFHLGGSDRRHSLPSFDGTADFPDSQPGCNLA